MWKFALLLVAIAFTVALYVATALAEQAQSVTGGVL